MGSFFKPGAQDLNQYGMGQGNRQQLAGDAYGQLHGIYGSDPNQFWGGKNAWTTGSGAEPAGGISWANLIGQGGPGGGGGGWGGGRAGAGSASAAQAAVAMGLEDPTYALDIPKEQEERLLGRANEMGSAQAADSWRRTQDELARSGSSSSPAALALQGNIERARLKGVADTHRDVKTDWYNSARGLRHGWNQLATEVNVSNAGFKTQAGIANAGNRTSASIANAGYGSQAAQAAAAREAAASMFLLGQRGEDESRGLQRYGALNSMNMGWQQPQAQKTQTPSGFSSLMGGLGAGVGMAGQVAGMGGFGGMWGNLFGGGQKKPYWDQIG